MATVSDNFTGGRDADLWDEVDDVGDGTIADANNQIECTIGSSNNWLGLVTKITYDLSEPSYHLATPTKIEKGFEIIICNNKTTDSNPYNLQQWIRIVEIDGTVYYQYKTDSVTTPGSTGGTQVNQVFKIDLPSSGDDVRFITAGTERASVATYPISSRNNYLYIGGVVETPVGDDEVDFDTFEALYVAAGGVAYTATGSIGFGGSLTRKLTAKRTVQGAI